MLANIKGIDRSNQEKLAELEAHGDWPGVVAFAERSIERDARTPEWWFVKGYALGQMDRWNDAQAALSESVKLDPQNLEAWQMLAQAQRLSGDAPRAAQTLERTLGLARDSSVTFYLLGETYAELNEHKRANTAYREALRLDPKFSEAWYGLGVMQARAGERSALRDTVARLQPLNAGLADRLLSLQ